MNSAKKLGVFLILLSILGDNPSTASSHTTTISDLPPDMLKEIFSKLDIHSLKSAAQVSKQFKGAACDLLTKEREAMEVKRQQDAEISEVMDIACNGKKVTEDEIIKAAKKVLSINYAPADSKLVLAKIVINEYLDWYLSPTVDQSIEIRDLFITFWDNNTFPEKDEYKALRDELNNTMAWRSHHDIMGLSQKSLAILKKYENRDYK